MAHIEYVRLYIADLIQRRGDMLICITVKGKVSFVRELDYGYHRTAGPSAIQPTGTVLWYYNNLLHREDGPAVINQLRSLKLYYINNRQIDAATQFFMKGIQ